MEQAAKMIHLRRILRSSSQIRTSVPPPSTQNPPGSKDEKNGHFPRRKKAADEQSNAKSDYDTQKESQQVSHNEARC